MLQYMYTHKFPASKTLVPKCFFIMWCCHISHL